MNINSVAFVLSTTVTYSYGELTHYMKNGSHVTFHDGDTGVIQSIERESGNGKTWNVRIRKANNTIAVKFVFTG
jgi:hypothetical protein